MTQKRILQSVSRALSVIEVLDKYGEQGVTELSYALSLEKSTVFRILTTLKEKQFIIQNPTNQKYSNSYKLFQIGNNIPQRTGLPKLAYPYMHQLSIKTGEAVNLAIRDGSKALYISKMESTDTIKVCMNLGQAIPLYCTALGKALIAWLSEESVRAILKDESFHRYTSNTICNMDQLIEELKIIRDKGYSVDDEEHIRGIHCIASPIFDSGGNILAALSIALPQFRFFEKQQHENLNELVLKVAHDFSISLGWRSKQHPLQNQNVTSF